MQLFVRQLGEGPRPKYCLAAIDKQECRIDLVRNLSDYDEAYFLERTLEQRLGIRDRAVDGEARS